MTKRILTTVNTDALKLKWARNPEPNKHNPQEPINIEGEANSAKRLWNTESDNEWLEYDGPTAIPFR